MRLKERKKEKECELAESKDTWCDSICLCCERTVFYENQSMKACCWWCQSSYCCCDRFHTTVSIDACTTKCKHLERWITSDEMVKNMQNGKPDQKKFKLEYSLHARISNLMLMFFQRFFFLSFSFMHVSLCLLIPTCSVSFWLSQHRKLANDFRGSWNHTHTHTHKHNKRDN